MNRIILYIALLFIITTAFQQTHAQILKPDSLHGDWLCKEVNLIGDFSDPKAKGPAEEMKKAFMNIRFIFRPNGKLNFIMPKESSQEVKEVFSFLDNSTWTYDPIMKMVHISAKEDSMDIEVKETKGDVFFFLEGSPILLKMEKRPIGK